MTSTFTASKGIEKPGSGDYNNTWATPVNADWDIVDTALGGTTLINAVGASGTVTLTLTQYRPPLIKISGLLTANVNYQLPSGIGGFWSVYNNTTGSFTVTISSAGGGTSVVLPQGYSTAIVSDGTNIGLSNSTPVAASGSNTQVQFNSSGLLAGSAGLTWSGSALSATAFSGPLTGNVTGNTAGTHTGAVIGNVTGNVSGSSGSCTGNAATATSATTATTAGNVSGIVALANGGTGANYASTNALLTGLGFSSGNNANGYWTKTPNGAGGTAIEQWNAVTLSQGEGTVALTFPTAFTNAASISITAIAWGSSNSNDMWVQLDTGSVTVNGCNLRYQGSTGAASADGFNWIAKGY